MPRSLAAYELAPPLELFPLVQGGVNNHSVGIHTARGDYVLKVYTSYQDVASIEYEHDLLSWLGSVGLSFHVPVPLPMRDGRRLCRGPGGWMSLMPLLPGTCPEFRLLNGRRDPCVLEYAEAMGAALGELQVALQSYPMLPRPGRSLFGALFRFPPPARDPFTLTPEHLGLSRLPPYEELFGWWRSQAAELQAFIIDPYRALPWQVCHNDFAPANLLIEQGRLSAVLDFEFATLAPRALDIAMGLRMVMQTWENPEPWDIARRYLQGYARWICMTEAEVLALPTLIRLRTAIPLLGWLGRSGARGDLGRIPVHIERLRHVTRWLDSNAGQLVELAMREAG